MTHRSITLAPAPTLSASERLRLAIDMADLGISMKRQNLRRASPTASEAEIAEQLHLWLIAPR